MPKRLGTPRRPRGRGHGTGSRGTSGRRPAITSDRLVCRGPPRPASSASAHQRLAVVVPMQAPRLRDQPIAVAAGRPPAPLSDIITPDHPRAIEAAARRGERSPGWAIDAGASHHAEVALAGALMQPAERGSGGAWRGPHSRGHPDRRTGGTPALIVPLFSPSAGLDAGQTFIATDPDEPARGSPGALDLRDGPWPPAPAGCSSRASRRAERRAALVASSRPAHGEPPPGERLG
jgi:hypothetical protein